MGLSWNKKSSLVKIGLVVLFGGAGLLLSLEAVEDRIGIRVDGSDNQVIDFPSEEGTYHKIVYTPRLGKSWEVVDMCLGTNGMQSWSSGDTQPAANFGFYRVSTQPATQPDDEDGDGMDDVFELTYDNLNPFYSGDYGGDEDADGLANYKEWQLGLNPMQLDSDADGVSDGAEIQEFRTDPSVANSSLILAEVNGADFSDPKGTWIIQGVGAAHTSLRGSVDYRLSVPESGIFILELDVKHDGTGVRPFELMVELANASSTDGFMFLGKKSVRVSGAQTRRVQYLLPHLPAAGDVNIRVVHNGYDETKRLVLGAVRIREIDGEDLNGNGLADWIDRLFETNTSFGGPSVTPVSFAYLEGRALFPDLVTGVTLTLGAQTQGRFALEVDFQDYDHDEFLFSVDFQSGAFRRSHVLKWGPKNIMDGGSLVFYGSQKVKLGAWLSDGISRSFSIDIPDRSIHWESPIGGAVNGERVAYIPPTFPFDRELTVTATIMKDGVPIVSSMTIERQRLRSGPSTLVAQRGQALRVNSTFLDDLQVESGRDLLLGVVGDPITDVDVQLDEITSRDASFVARSETEGPIIVSATVRPMDLRLSVPVEERRIATRDDGQALYHNVLTGYLVRENIELFIDAPEDAVFSNGGRGLIVRAVQLNEEGEFHFITLTRQGIAPVVRAVYPGFSTQSDITVSPELGALVLNPRVPSECVCSNSPPVLTVPSDIRITTPLWQEPEGANPRITGIASAIDDCDEPMITYVDRVSDDSFIQRTWTATDACGQTSDATQLIAIGPDRLYLENSGDFNKTATCLDAIPMPDLAYYDECPGEPVITFNDFPGGDRVTREWIFSNSCGHVRSVWTAYVFSDTTAPQVIAPVDVMISCGASTNTNATGVATAIDECNEEVTVTFEDEVVDPGCPGLLRRVWRATDVNGNSTISDQLIHIEGPPGFSLAAPADIRLTGCGAVDISTNVTGVATLISDCEAPEITLTFTDQLISDGCPQVIRRIWVGADQCGRNDESWQIITIVDEIFPEIEAPDDLSVLCSELESQGTNLTGVATGADDCSGVEIGYDDQLVSIGCHVVLHRTWSATDACGNTSFALQRVDITDDVPPVLTLPPDTTQQCNNGGYPFASLTGVATAVDSCDPNPIITFTEETIGIGCPRLILRNWVASDACGNTTSAVQRIVVSNTGRLGLLPPPDAFVVDVGEIAPALTGEPILISDCDQAVTVSHSDSALLPGCPQKIERTWSALDPCNGSVSVTQNIFVDDGIPLAVTVPPFAQVLCGQSTHPSVTGYATVQHDSDNFILSYEDELLGTDCPKLIRRSWIAEDECNNTVVEYQYIQETVSSGLVLIPPPFAVADCASVPATGQTGFAEVYSTCETETSISFTDQAMVSNEMPYVQRTWFATNACGESATAQQLIGIEDLLAPELTVPVDAYVPCDADISTNLLGVAVAVDNCSTNVVIGSSDRRLGEGCPRRILRVWTATDAAGNTAEGLQVIHLGSDVTSCPPEATDAVFPDSVKREKELLIRDLSVVNSPLARGNGRWSFYGLMRDSAGTRDPKEFILDWMRQWESDQIVNSFVIPRRPDMRRLVIDHWKRLDHPNSPLVSDAEWVLNPDHSPFELMAIVNRIDLSCEVNGQVMDAGEGRFVFSVRGATGPLPFTVIFEYEMVAHDVATRGRWAHNWRALGGMRFGEEYNLSLRVLTDCFARPENLRTIRTNENALRADWELREFHLEGDGILNPATVERTPDLAQFNVGSPLNDLLVQYLNENADAILEGRHEVPDTFGPLNVPFLASSAPNVGIWQAPGISPEVRHAFALNTCMGCHLNETGATFRHIFPRDGRTAGLSRYLNGDVFNQVDPVSLGITNRLNPIQRRKQILRAFADQTISGVVDDEVQRLLDGNPFRSH